MNCKIVQRRLLGAEDPGHPSREVQAHLDACAACREWQVQLVQVEQQVRLLPVPDSRSRAGFLQQLLQAETVAPAPPVVPVSERARPRGTKSTRVIRRIPSPAATAASVAFPWRLWTAGMAAALALFAVTWWAVREPTVIPAPVVKARPDPLVASLVKHDLKLVSTKKSAERADVLTEIADELVRERQSLTGEADTNELVADFDNWHKNVAAAVAGLNDRRTVNVVTSISTAPKADATRVQQLQRNRHLIGELVAAGLRLAGQQDLFKRVECCQGLADRLALEIQDAAGNQEGSRAVEMGNHFKDLLCSGVASNLTALRVEIPSGSAFEGEFKRVGRLVETSTVNLEEHLLGKQGTATGAFRGEIDSVLSAVKEGRERVRKAAQLS